MSFNKKLKIYLLINTVWMLGFITPHDINAIFLLLLLNIGFLFGNNRNNNNE